MDEVFARRDLIDPAELRRLCEPSDRAGFLQLGLHLGLIALAVLALRATLGTVWAALPFVVLGVLLNFLYAGQHELSHWTVFRTRWLNEWVGRAFGFVLFYPRTFDQIQHGAHHRYTQDWARDGELARPHYSRASYLLWLFGPSYWFSRIRRIFRLAAVSVVEPYIPANRKAEVIREARIHLAGYVLIAVASLWTENWAAVIYWLAPMFLTKVAHQLQNTIEHLGLPHGANILENTRSTRTNAVMRFLCWNMQYHTAHHAFPGVPFHALTQVNALVRGRIEVSAPGYLALHRALIRRLRAAGAGEHREAQ